LLASTVAEISRESQIFLDAPLAQIPANFGPKRCFTQATLVPKWCKNSVAQVHV